MRKIYTIGETVYDIIFKDSHPLAAKPGGAMLNSSISLGRLGLPVSFISEIGEDRTGDIIIRFLNDNKVDTSCTDRFSDGKTALALAFLDDIENTSYSFYKLYPKERLKTVLPVPDHYDMVLFGSFYSITPEVRTPLINFIKSANQNKAIIIYDPNFRRPHVKDLPEAGKLISENINLANIIRGSEEDFKFIFSCENADDTFLRLQGKSCRFLIYTRGSRKVEFRSEKIAFSSTVPLIDPVSSIGAGDSFNAGLIHYFFSRGITSEGLCKMNERQWKEAIDTAISFGSHACQHLDNYISWEFARGCLNLM